jgi:hypothetical protein
VCLFAVSIACATPFTRTSPTGGALPAGVTEVGGIVVDLQGAGGIRVVSQLAASSLFIGYANSGSPVAYRGNPMTIGIQSGFTPSVLASLGGGIASMAVRITLEDGDTGSGNFDDDQNTLIVNGVPVGNFSDVVTEETSGDGLTQYSQNASGGFRNGTLDTGFFVVSNPADLAAILAALTGSGQLVFQLNDDDPNDNYFDFTGGVDGGLINTGTGPTVAPGAVGKAAVKKSAPQPIRIVDAGAIANAVGSALPAAVSHRTAMLGFSRVAARDLNARLFRSRARSGSDRDAESTKLNEAALSDRLRVFASADASASDAEPNDGGLGFDADTLSASGGIEYFLDRSFNLGFGVAVFQGDGDLDGDLASIETDGLALSPYVTYIRGAFHADALYSLGLFSSDIERPTGAGKASGDTDSLVHALEFNAGYNFERGGLVAGPIAGVEFRHGTIDGYSEDDRWAAVGYDKQTFESLISRVGAQASFPVSCKGIRVVPQVRAAWEHEYMDDAEDISVRLLTSPVTIVDGSGASEGEPFSAALRTATLEEDYLSAGAGVLVEVSGRVQILLDYEGHFFRGDSSLHMAAIRVIVDL